MDVAKAVSREVCLALNPYVAAGGAQNQWSKIPSLEAKKEKHWTKRSQAMVLNCELFCPPGDIWLYRETFLIIPTR